MQARLAKVDLLPVVGLALAFALGILVTSPQGRLTFSLLVAFAYAIVILRAPIIGLLLWMVSFPFAYYLHFDVSFGGSMPDLTLSRLCAGTLLLILLAQMATGRRKPVPITAVDALAVLALLGIGLSITMAEAKMHAAQSFLDHYALPIAFYWIAKNLVQTKSDRQRLIVALVIVGVYSSAAAIVEQFTGHALFYTGEIPGGMYSKSVRRLVGLLGSPVAFGIVLGMALPFAIHFLLYASRPVTRLLLLVVTGAITVGLYATALRTAWIASFLGIVIVVLFHPVLSRRQVRRVTLVLLTLAVVLAIPFGNMLARAAFESPIIADRLFSSGPVVARIVLYSTSWRMARENLIRGIGYENFKQEYTRYLTGWGSIPAIQGAGADAPHNSFVYVLVSAGMLGFVPYALLFILIVFQVGRAHRREDSMNGKGLFIAFWVAMLSYVLNAMTADVIYVPNASTYFFTLLGVFLAPIVSKPRSESGSKERGQM